MDALDDGKSRKKGAQKIDSSFGNGQLWYF